MSVLVIEREITPCAVSRNEVALALATRTGLPLNTAAAAVVAVFGSNDTLTVDAVVGGACEAALDVVEAHARLFPGLLPLR